MLKTESSTLRTGMLVQIESTGQVGRISNFHDENPYYPFNAGEFVYIVALDGTWSEYAQIDEFIILEWDADFYRGDEIVAHDGEHQHRGYVLYAEDNVIHAVLEHLGLRSVFNSQVTYHQLARRTIAKLSA